MPKWLIQPVKIEAEKIINLINLLDRGAIAYDIVYPLEGKILNPDKTEYVFDVNENYFVCGSYSLTRYVHAIKPEAVFTLEDYKFDDLMNIFGKDNFVNPGATVIHTKNIDWKSNDEYFVRPLDDTKSFNGGIYNAYMLKYEGEVVIASLKHISREYRFFVIDGKIVTSSLYKVNGQLEESEIIDSNAQAFAQEMIEKFSHPGFVIDIATVNNEYKIMELNCLNAAGFYKINLYKLIMAVEDHYENKKGRSLKI